MDPAVDPKQLVPYGERKSAALKCVNTKGKHAQQIVDDAWQITDAGNGELQIQAHRFSYCVKLCYYKQE